jgi:AraC-like DNA-binding protein
VLTNVHQPSVHLKRFVLFYAHTKRDCSTQTFVQPVPARTPQVMEFTLGDPFEVRCDGASTLERSHPVTIVGAQTHRRVCLAMRGQVESFVIVFQPGGLSALFALPADLLTDRHFEARSVLGPTIDRLWSQIGECLSFAERARVADRYLLQRSSGSDSGDSVLAAARYVLSQPGSQRVATMANRSGLSIRQFERRFVTQMGLPPKSYARVARFEAALRAKMRTPHRRWTDIAHDLGYHDQMHMVHDFRQLAGATPATIAPQLDMFVRDQIDGTSEFDFGGRAQTPPGVDVLPRRGSARI